VEQHERRAATTAHVQPDRMVHADGPLITASAAMALLVDQRVRAPHC